MTMILRAFTRLSKIAELQAANLESRAVSGYRKPMSRQELQCQVFVKMPCQMRPISPTEDSEVTMTEVDKSGEVIDP